jgi:hypothetical protein
LAKVERKWIYCWGMFKECVDSKGIGGVVPRETEGAEETFTYLTEEHS